METNIIYNECCLKGMEKIPDNSIDMILSDIPYGTTRNKWDSVLDLDNMWKHIYRIVKPKAPMIFFSSQPFTTTLINSNRDHFKYDLIWEKSHSTGHLNCKIQPLRKHETILIFGKGKINYFHKLESKPLINQRIGCRSSSSSCYNNFKVLSERTIPYDKKYPSSIIKIPCANNGEKGLHPTQKPIALIKYLIENYSKENDMVLDICMGSGTTAIACIDTNRRYIGFEKDELYFIVSQHRVSDHLKHKA